MCYYYHPSTGEVTDPKFVSALIDVIRKDFGRNFEVFVVESDASAMKCKYIFRMLGYDRLAEEKDFRLVNLSEERNKVVDIEIYDEKFRFYVPELFYEADLVINVPKLKYMSNVKITCALKNMFGCNAYPRKFVYHKALNEAIVAINKLIKTDLIIVDGLIVNGKYTKKLSMVISSKDPVALDTAVSKIMGINPKSVKHLVLAFQQGLGVMSFLPVGDFSYITREFPKKSLKDNIRETLATVYLRLVQDQ
jgi:uncharacterized protein (DUF362 family)